FSRATIEGQDASVRFNLPWVARLGVEVAPFDGLRVELAGTVEGWHVHDEIVFAPEGLVLRDVPGFPARYTIGEQVIERNFRNAYAVRLGGEYTHPVDVVDLTFRLGVGYETSAVPDAYLSPLTVDLDKVNFGTGFAVGYGDARFDIVYSHIFSPDVDVSPDEAQLAQLSPLIANNPDPVVINAGTYGSSAHVLGIGLTYDLDPVFGTDDPTPEEASKSE
ncbi:MAG: outer membrane protein transport protein, partial [Myxococcota bacterium]